jgi:ribonuclease Z
VFLEQDADHAARKAHLMATQAGAIARAARAKTAVPFHFSTRYFGREQDVRREFQQSFGNATDAS